MTTKPIRRSFTTALHYLDHQQTRGEAYGSLRMLNRRFEFGKSLYSKDLFAHYGCVNAIEFSNNGEWLVSGGDDKRVLIWNIDRTLSNSRQPKVMKGEHHSNIFCLGFSYSNAKLFSAGNDEQVILHDVATSEAADVFLHDEAVYGLSVDPFNEDVFASACDDGRILIWDTRSTLAEPFVLDTCSSAYHAVMYNPVEPKFLATANAKDGVCLWDIRKPKQHYIKYGPTLLSQSAMSVRFNSTGTHLLALRRRFPPVLYEITSTQPTAEFDHNEYYNSCTMKSCCFAGDKDQFILSGSDDFKLYVWKIPDCVEAKKGMMVKKAHFILRGHRSIVNQVRYNNAYGMLASSGVEKIVKLWSSFPLTYQDDSNSYVTSKDYLRKVYSHEEYVNLVLESGQFMTHDYSHHSIQEDPRMMAFFDSLVQRDIEGWTSDSSDATEAMNTCYVVQSADSMSSSLSSSSDDEETLTSRIVAHMRQMENYAASGLDFPIAQGSAGGSGDLDGDQSSDRISMLIAQKRKEQMLKAQRASLQLDKKTRKSKRKSSSSIIGSGSGYGVLSNGISQPKEQQRTDRRKWLRKQRAKFARARLFDGSSSFSDEDDNKGTNRVATEAVDDNQDDIGTSSCPISPNSDEDQSGLSSSFSSNVSHISNKHKSFSAIAAEIPHDFTSSNNSVQLPSAVNSSSIGTLPLNAAETVTNETDSNVSNVINETDNSISTDSKSATIFPLKGGKRNGRNYRKRGADELDE
ncbi:hypothetical protein JTE90_026320 [Oedothorax gibbosus]|uniref:DDB1-and CUL4-associated factor 5 n=1 Tax=Oedothorax gibbosus TaxID=931172 RepID=A0AAV6U6Z8_9ARAC|nr:hypothetical protein JTE90_026320 [Oedothorax gibbosus]